MVSYKAPEFLNINETFNTMADNIHQLKIEKYEAELRRQKMELRNLQLQIRPHFLLNTFNLMYSLSQLDDRENLENTYQISPEALQVRIPPLYLRARQNLLSRMTGPV